MFRHMVDFAFNGQWFLFGCLIFTFVSSHSSNEIVEPNMLCGLEDDLIYRTNLYSRELWPDARVPYIFDTTFGESCQQIFNEAVEHFRKYTCIRFEPKTVDDVGYIRVRSTFENSSICGRAALCNQKKEQDLEIQWDCCSLGVIVHEMMHTLCLIHEHNRADRDDFLSFPNCDNPVYIEPKQINGGHLYDYESVLHYQCRGGCIGKPKLDGVKYCGLDANRKGLSVLDADKLNAYYMCPECHRHRWYNAHNMSKDHWKNLVDFSKEGIDLEPIHVCRGYGHDGEILPGRYYTNENICQVNSLGKLLNITEHIELLALPSDNKMPTVTRGSSNYRLIQVTAIPDETLKGRFVAVGRYTRSKKIFLAISNDYQGNEGKTNIGTLSEFHATATFWYPIEGEVFKEKYFIWACLEM